MFWAFHGKIFQGWDGNTTGIFGCNSFMTHKRSRKNTAPFVCHFFRLNIRICRCNLPALPLSRRQSGGKYRQHKLFPNQSVFSECIKIGLCKEWNCPFMLSFTKQNKPVFSLTVMGTKSLNCQLVKEYAESCLKPFRTTVPVQNSQSVNRQTPIYLI